MFGSLLAAPSPYFEARLLLPQLHTQARPEWAPIEPPPAQYLGPSTPRLPAHCSSATTQRELPPSRLRQATPHPPPAPNNLAAAPSHLQVVTRPEPPPSLNSAAYASCLVATALQHRPPNRHQRENRPGLWRPAPAACTAAPPPLSAAQRGMTVTTSAAGWVVGLWLTPRLIVRCGAGRGARAISSHGTPDQPTHEFPLHVSMY